jgi:hypothetical protein
VAELLDAAEQRWPEITDRRLLLLRLAEEGHNAMASAEETRGAQERHARLTSALERIPSLVDRELLLSDRAWS